MSLKKTSSFLPFIIFIIICININYILNSERINTNTEDFKSQILSKIAAIEELTKNKSNNKFGEISFQQSQSGFYDSNECLLDEKKVKEILTQMGLEKVIDDNLRFALGPCNPVILIPGIYGTRLVLQLDCKKFARKKENLINLRLFCGSSMCKNNEGEEEHVIWPALLDSPFELFTNPDNAYSSCFAHFFNYYKENECPKDDKDKSENFLGGEESQSICWNDEAVKIIFYGATEKTEKNLQCGIAPIKNIMSSGNTYIPENWINFGSTLGFNNMYNRYHEMGYRSGFSIAGVPYDFRRFVNTNENFKNVLINQIERLYENTGKQVIIVAHSFGNINFLDTLYDENSNIKAKIKKYIALGPPYSGASKDIQLFLLGSKEFGTDVSIWGHELIEMGLDTFAQQLITPFIGSGFELRPNPLMHKLSKQAKYSEFIKAFDEMILLEKFCRNQDCSDEYVIENSKYLEKYFPFLPKFYDRECKIEDLINSDIFKNFEKNYQSNPKLNSPFVLPCRFGIFDILNCPLIRYRQNEKEDSSIIENDCLNTQKYNNQNKTHYYNHICESENENNSDCLDHFFHKNFPYPYDTEKMKFLFDRFEKKYSSLFPDLKLNMTTYFDSKIDLQRKIEKMIHHQEAISNVKEMQIPDVDTIILFSSFSPSQTAYLYDPIKNKKEFSNDDILYRHGDGSVPTWTSLITAMKWIYDKKLNNLDNKIQLVEFCSLLGGKDSKYAFDDKNLDKEFMAIGCDCISEKGFYDFNSVESGKCTHAVMTLDSRLIKFVEKYLIDDINRINNNDDVENMNELRRNAIKSYNASLNYEIECNKKLRELIEQKN